MLEIVEEIYIAPEGSVPMTKVSSIGAIAGCGLDGDRYCEGTGYWTPVGDICEVTLIAFEDLNYIQQELGLEVMNGEHRRNLVTSGIDLDTLAGKRFRIGEAVLRYDRPRPPCKHIQDLTEPGMTRALVGRGGHCARVEQAGEIHPGDGIELE